MQSPRGHRLANPQVYIMWHGWSWACMCVLELCVDDSVRKLVCQGRMTFSTACRPGARAEWGQWHPSYPAAFVPYFTCTLHNTATVLCVLLSIHRPAAAATVGMKQSSHRCCQPAASKPPLLQLQALHCFRTWPSLQFVARQGVCVCMCV